MKTIKLGLCLVGALLILVGSVTPALADAIFWTETGTAKVQTADLDGSNVSGLATGGVPLGIAVDPNSQKIYWVDNNAIKRANFDGTGAQSVLTGLGNCYGLALDVANGKMYWTEYSPGKVRRANLDGTGVEDLSTVGSQLRGIKLDLVNGKIYWVDSGTGIVRRSNLDGSGETVFFSSGYNPQDIALDIAAGRLYWSESHSGVSVYRIRYANLSDGSGQTDLVSSGVTSPHFMDIDLVNKTLYWTTLSSTIQRVDLDGSNLQTIVTGLNTTRGIAVHVIPEPVSLLLVSVGAAVLLRRMRRQ